MERAEYDFNLKTPPLPAVDLALARERRERVVALSRHKYATPRAEIEALLRQGAPAAEPAPIKEEESRPRRREPEPAAPAISRPTEPPPATHAIPRSVQVPSAGRGGAQHKYLQELIRRWAETRGWRVEIEKQVLDGLGSVDIALAKGQMRVACEITVTTSPEHELGNVQKCLASGFEQVIVVSPERQILNKVRARITSGLDAKLAERVRFFTVEELFSFLEDLEAHAATKEQHLLGYKVRTEHQAMAPEDQKARRRAVSEVILGALKRLRGKE